MSKFEAALSTINGHVDGSLKRITEIGGALRIGGWIATWGSWQIFKHNVSDKCNVLRGVAVSTKCLTSFYKHDNSCVCIVQVCGTSVLKFDGKIMELEEKKTVTLPPDVSFTLDPIEEGSEFIMIIIPPMAIFNDMLSADSLVNSFDTCEAATETKQ